MLHDSGWGRRGAVDAGTEGCSHPAWGERKADAIGVTTVRTKAFEPTGVGPHIHPCGF